MGGGGGLEALDRGAAPARNSVVYRGKIPLTLTWFVAFGATGLG